jgi:hypothetical protein
MIMIMNMKKLNSTVTILVCVVAAGLASAQNPSIIQNTRNTMNAVSNNSTAASNEALGIHQSAASKPAAAKSSAAIAIAPTPAKPASVPVPAPVKIVPVSGVKTVAVGAVKVDAVKVAAAKHHGQPKAAILGVKASTPAPAVANIAPVGAQGETGNEQPVVPDGKYAANGRRDPFISPVVSHAGGSGCSTGKKCLEIGAINLRGVVHGENGFIAVVSNSLNKAYFLRENDPVFNGYVVKITGDSVVFQETLQDRLGKTFTREVVKKITTPAV